MLRVDGLTCPHCACGLERQLRRIEGVIGVDMNIPRGQVSFGVATGERLGRHVRSRP